MELADVPRWDVFRFFVSLWLNSVVCIEDPYFSVLSLDESDTNTNIMLAVSTTAKGRRQQLAKSYDS